MDFEYTLSDDKTINIIVSYLKKNKNYSKNNLHLAFGVKDKNNKIFVTVISYVTDCMKCGDGDYNETLYIVIIKNQIYSILIKSSSEEIIFPICMNKFGKYKEIIKGAIIFSENNTTYEWIKNSLLIDNPKFDLHDYNVINS